MDIEKKYIQLGKECRTMANDILLKLENIKIQKEEKELDDIKNIAIILGCKGWCAEH